MDQRQPGDRTDLEALARDVGQARYDDRLDGQSFQLPGRPPELLGGREGAFGEQDDLGGVLRDDGRRGVGVAEDRDAGGGLPRAYTGRGERSQHRVPQPRLTAQHGRHLVDVSRVPGDDELLAEVAAHPGPLDGSPQRHATQDDERCSDGEGEEEEAAREREAGQVAADADQTGAEQRGPDDPLVLLGPGPEDLPGVPADNSQHDEPPRQERSRGHEHDGGDVVARVEERQLLATEHRRDRRRCEQEDVDGNGRHGHEAGGQAQLGPREPGRRALHHRHLVTPHPWPAAADHRLPSDPRRRVPVAEWNVARKPGHSARVRGVIPNLGQVRRQRSVAVPALPTVQEWSGTSTCGWIGTTSA